MIQPGRKQCPRCGNWFRVTGHDNTPQQGDEYVLHAWSER